MRRNFSGPGARFENLDEPTPIDLSRDPAANMKDLLDQITSKEMMSTTKRMGHINNFTKLIQSVGENANFGYSLEDIIKCLMLPLVSAAKELRAAGLRAFRHLFYDEKTLSKILEFRIDIFIVRSMDMVHNAFEVERVQALRFIRKIIAVSPHLCPMSMAATLVSIGNDEGDDADRLRKACVATLCELAIKSIQTASYCGGINTIIRNVLDSQMQRFNESLMATLLYLLNNPESRLYVRSDVGLESVLAPFTDLHYRHNPDTPETHLREDRASRLQASKMAIVTIFRSWSGVISLCRPDGKGVQSLLGVFCLPNSDVRKGIMDIVFEIFQLKEPDWTDDFSIALLSVDPCQMQDAWKLSEGFVAEEAKALLPHRATGRTNLVKNYIALVLAAFMNAGLFESLVEVITSSDPFLSVRATILLGELLHLANTLLPPECSSHTHCVPMLVNTASLFEVTIEERSRASIAVNCLDRLHQTKKRGLVPCSLYLSRIVSKAHTLEPKVKDKLHRDRLKACLNKELDDPLFSSLRDTQVLMERDFRNWDWHLISSTLQSPTVTMRKLEETSNQKFIRNLLYFYKPSSQRFCTVHISDPQARTFSEVGCLVIDFLLDGEDVAEGLLLHDLVQDIGECLQEVLLQHSKALSPSITTGVLSNNNVLSTLSRDYFLFLGKLAGTKVGSKLMERTGVYQYLLELCSIPSRDSLQKLIVASLDYSHTGIPRIILSKILTASSSATRLYSTSHMRVLLRARVAFFHSWGIELLVTQLYDTDNQVAVEAADVLDEACEDEANLQYLIELSPVLLHLGEVGHRLLTRFVSVESGLKYLTQRGYLQPLLDNWRKEYNTAYVRWVEELLAESLTSYVKKSDDNTYIRRSNKRLVLKDAFLPPHLYGQLVQKKNGFKLLQKSNDVELFARTLQTLEPKTKEQVDELKAALWALGHVGSTNWGINFLVEEAIIPEIVRLAEDCDNFAIRGTCYYVLGLIAKTREGADILRELEWESVRHMGEDKWPVLETSLENKEEVVPLSYILEPQSKPAPSVLSGISETERAGGIYLGEESKATEGSTAYDKFSGIYLGEDKGSSRKTSIEEASEGGILSLWYKNAERRRKIASRESGFYDERSGVYLGEESPSVSEPTDEGVITPAPGGILERLFTETGLDLSAVNKESKMSHRRNYSEGNFSVATFGEKDSTFETLDVKRRAVSNVDRIGSPLKSVSEHSVDDVRASNGVGLRPFHKHTASAPSEHVPQMDGTMSDGDRTNRRSVSESIAYSALKPEIRNRMESEVTDMSSFHVRSGSNLSSASVDSGDFLEMSYIASRSRTSSASETGGYLQQESPTSQSLLSVNSDDTAKTLGEKDLILDSSADSLQGGLLYESPTAYSSSELLRRSSSPSQEDRKRLPINELLQNDLQSRQRSTSLTEKRRMGSPSLGIIPETRSSSFSGSTDFSKMASKSRSSSDAELMHVSPVENLNDLHGSNRSLAEVKILSDKTIVFRSGVESKTRAMSVDSASSSGLRRDRLLVNSSQISGDESDGNVSRSRGSSFEKADFARKLGLKSGDLSRVRRTRSTSSGHSSNEGLSPKKIVNKNRLFGSIENNTVISGDLRRNSSASSEASLFTSSRDAFGYTALSTLRRQRSFNRDLEKKVNAFGTTRAGTFQFPRSMSAAEFSSTKRDSLASISSAFDFRQFKSTNKNIGNEFLGLCLPRDLSSLFQTEPYEFQGSWADHFVAAPSLLPPFVVSSTKRENRPSHDKSRCLGCMYTNRVGTGRDRTKSSDNVNDGEWTKLPPVMEANAESVDSTIAFSFAKSESDSSVTATSLLAKGSKVDENTTEGKRLFRAEILRIVASLSSVVASRAHQEELNKLREKCSHLFQDLCLYSEVCDILALYKFKLHIRRFIQGLFANVNFDPIIEQADLVLGREQSDSSSA